MDVKVKDKQHEMKDLAVFPIYADEAEASVLPSHGKDKPAAGCTVSVSHLPANQEEASVREINYNESSNH